MADWRRPRCRRSEPQTSAPTIVTLHVSSHSLACCLLHVSDHQVIISSHRITSPRGRMDGLLCERTWGWAGAMQSNLITPQTRFLFPSLPLVCGGGKRTRGHNDGLLRATWNRPHRCRNLGIRYLVGRPFVALPSVPCSNRLVCQSRQEQRQGREASGRAGEIGSLIRTLRTYVAVHQAGSDGETILTETSASLAKRTGGVSRCDLMDSWASSPAAVSQSVSQSISQAM
ncbi:uncharacterized protein J3D65DRAFT_621717 [Phyllosticta citribraziliensis]|uniref:Uncharacterized protein n=1 Tax=Phyllosticta citribraziliensis TaxID=989973 RepID=A0ABR1LT67_9PEZI